MNITRMGGNVLILGGEGYIGSSLTLHLDKPYLFGNRQTDYNTLPPATLQQFEYVILLAGHSSVQSCHGPLISPWLNNVGNFKWLIDHTLPSQKIIYASSSSVYGNKNTGISEEHNISLDYINNYDLTKTTLDLYALQQIGYGRQIIGLRFGTVNGGSPVIRRDLMINSMVYSAIQDNQIIVTNKHVRRPILFINDLCRAVQTIIANKFISGLYNLASFNSTVDEISSQVSQQTGAKIVDSGDKEGVYDFAISTKKFTQTYDFKFEGTVEEVVTNVLQCYTKQSPKVVLRNLYFEYPAKHD